MNEEPIKVAQIVGKWVGGGVESVIMNYYRHIDRAKVQFDFICDLDSTDIPYKEIENLGGRVILVPPYQKIFQYIKELKKVLKENNYKIVHSHINALSVFPLFAAKLAGVPVRIAHSHSTSNKKEWKKNLIKNILRPFSKVFATDYMCCSEHAGRWLFGNKEYDKGSVYILNNAIDLNIFKYNKKIRKAKRNEIGISNNTKVIGHVGRFVEQKNHTFIIDVFNEVHKEDNNTILLLAGQGPLEPKIKEKVIELGLEESVKFLGQRNDIEDLYQAFDIFLFPSIYEGLGLVLIEAQSSGLNCVASTEVPSKAKVTNLLTFLDLDGNFNEWTNTIIKLMKRKNSRKIKRKKFANKGFDINTEASKLLNKYIVLQNQAAK